MAFMHTRTQWPVGQGGFHSATLTDGAKVLHYVYDCGAMQKFGRQRDAMIDDYITALKHTDKKIDVLFLSHVHADHVNGVERLLCGKAGLPVDTIVLPLLNVKERLAAYARAAATHPAYAATPFYRNFIVNPAGAVRAFNPRRVLMVRTGPDERESPGAPGSGNTEPRPRELPDGAGGERAPAPPWILVGQGLIEPLAPHLRAAAGTPGAPLEVVMDDTLGLVFPGAHKQDWLLAPFVDPGIEADVEAFMDELARRLEISRRRLGSHLRTAGGIRKLLETGMAALVGAYKTLGKDLNITSLSLYSGPLAARPAREPWRLSAELGEWSVFANPDERVAWLGTGDAALADATRRGKFLTHYGAHLGKVSTMMLPHHGSDHNFHADLAHQISPQIYVAAADRTKDWRHPGTIAMQTVASVGRFISVVTANDRSAINELVT